jgi:hypothetical protein
MKHARNIAIEAGATGSSIDVVAEKMTKKLNVTLDNAHQILKHELTVSKGS